MKNDKTIPAQEAFDAFRNSRNIISSTLIPFRGAEGYDVYNPSMPFRLDGSTWMAGRVESRDGTDSRVFFFEQKISGGSEEYHWREDTPVYVMEDPFVCTVAGELILGGVEVEWDGSRPVSIVTVFYRGKSLHSMEKFAEGPRNMKDIRLVELPDGRIGIFTRPRDLSKLEEWGSIARIGFTTVSSLDGINGDVITNATLLGGHFKGFEWGGCNEAVMLRNGLIGVVGHRSWGVVNSYEDMVLHYYGFAFALDPKTLECTPSKIIISRDCFPDAPPKREGLEDVTFTSGLIRNPDGTAKVYTGLSDSAVGMAVIPDPFLEWDVIT